MVDNKEDEYSTLIRITALCSFQLGENLKLDIVSVYIYYTTNNDKDFSFYFS